MHQDAGVVDLLGMLAYGELSAFDRMATDAKLAPDLSRRAMLAEMAADEMANYRLLADRLDRLGVEPEEAMRPFVASLDAFHDNTVPASWLEALTKAYVGEGISDDFFREVAKHLAVDDRALVLDVLHADSYAEFAATEIRAAIETDPKIANRLSMWARRLMGEALSQAQRVAAERAPLTALILAGAADQSAVQDLLRRLSAAHQARMAAVGLNN